MLGQPYMLIPELDENSKQGDTLGMHVICDGLEGILQDRELECHDLQVRGTLASSLEIVHCLEWSFKSDLTRLIRLADISRVASAFASPMYDFLVLRPKLVATVGVVSHSMAKTSIAGRATYMQECMSSSR